jgi:hypothetical protein
MEIFPNKNEDHHDPFGGALAPPDEYKFRDNVWTGARDDCVRHSISYSYTSKKIPIQEIQKRVPRYILPHILGLALLI